MDATLQAQKRSDKGKNEARRHRASGRLPAVVYGPVTGGGKEATVPVTVDPKALSRILHSDSGANTLITLRVEGESDARVLERGETVKLSSFGSFVVRKKGQRIGRNPKTGKEVPISPRRVMVFKPSAILKQRINGVDVADGAED